jgi:Flp pilus assembly protein TadG
MRKTDRTEIRARARRPIAVVADRGGAAAVEFALVLPALLVIILGILQFGLTLNNYLELTDAVRDADRNFSISRSVATPFSSTKTELDASAANLNSTTLNTGFHVFVNGVECTSDSGCVTALSTAQGLAAKVNATYSCNLTVMNVNFAPGCTLTSSTTELVE